MKQARQIFWNALLLTGASLLMRTVGVAFQVAISNRAGAEAMGLFSLMSGVYGFALTLATSGIHLGVTRVVTETVSQGQPGRVRAVVRKAVAYALTCGVLASVLLASGAHFIGVHWLKDARTVSSLRLFALTLPLISLSSVFSGYFVAMRRSYKNAAVQVLEQGAKIFFTMYLLALLSSGGVEQILAALVMGGAASELLSFLVEWLLLELDKRRHLPKPADQTAGNEGRKLIQITLPMALTAYIRSGLVTLQHILIPEGLRNSGSSHAASLAAYGSIHSMAMPIILYPAALISSFSGLLIPTMADCRVQNSKRRIRYMISRVWSLSMFFSIGVAGILICFSGEFGDLLYPGTEAGHYIRVLAPLIPIMYIDTATDAILKGIGEQVYSMNVNIADALISVVMVWLLIPRFGITGYLITIYFSECFNTVLSITRLLCVTETPTKLLKWVYKPLLCIVGATCAARVILNFVDLQASGVAALVLHCAGTLLLYLLFLILTCCVDREDLQWFGTLFHREKEEEPEAERPELAAGPSVLRRGRKNPD